MNTAMPAFSISVFIMAVLGHPLGHPLACTLFKAKECQWAEPCANNLGIQYWADFHLPVLHIISREQTAAAIAP